jgi:hypothetical protein
LKSPHRKFIQSPVFSNEAGLFYAGESLADTFPGEWIYRFIPKTEKLSLHQNILYKFPVVLLRFYGILSSMKKHCFEESFLSKKN